MLNFWESLQFLFAREKRSPLRLSRGERRTLTLTIKTNNDIGVFDRLEVGKIHLALFGSVQIAGTQIHIF